MKTFIFYTHNSVYLYLWNCCRSKTCPQCRERTTDNKIHRLYFNFSNNDSIKEDATFLQSKIDSLVFQLTLRDKNLSNLTEANKKLENQTAGLRHEVQKVESEINGKNSAIHALKEQIKFYKQQCSDTDTCRKENEQLKKNLEDLKKYVFSKCFVYKFLEIYLQF